jgi:hypothetical protein
LNRPGIVAILTSAIRYPPDTEEKQKQLGEFFGTYPPPKVAGQVEGYVNAIKTASPSIEKFAILGVRIPNGCESSHIYEEFYC